MANDISQSSLNLSPEEIRVYNQLFQQADTDGLGVVTGEVAVKFFERTKLDATVLGEIWQLADSENRGLLTPAGFSVALRLIGHCQAGRTPSIELASRPGPLPRFNGSNVPAQSQRPMTPVQPLNPQSTGGSFVNPQATGQPIRVPPLTPDKVVEYQSLFEKAGARNGILGGDAAKQMFEKAKLPNDALLRIWNLADVEQRGALNLTEFIIAMHLLTSMRTGALRAIPQNLPAGLYEAASRRPVSQGQPPGAMGAIQRQFTPQGHQRTASPLARPFGTPELGAQSTGNDWLVSPQDKAKFDQIFATVDKQGIGTINGDQAVQFFSNSGLSEDTLASIWDLADIRSEGQLNKDEFAVAMYLIRQQRGKRDDRDNLPTVLPPKLIPPSMRQKVMPPSQPTAPAFDNAAFASLEQPKSASEDLFGLDALATDMKSPQQTPAPMFPSPVAQPTQPILPQQSMSSPPISSSTFKPFMPSSAFGQGIAAQNNGPRTQSPALQSREFSRSQQSAADDLLGDNDPEISKKLTDETTEFANMSNQISTLRTQTQEVQNKKTAAENNLSATSTQKRELEARLAQIRGQYEQEVKQVKSLEERLNASRNDTRKLQQEFALLEGTYQDLQNQNQQTTAALEADQRENAALKERMRQMNAEVAGLRPYVDKLKSDLRQQKGLVAINKKQLATSEAERDRLQSDMSEAKREHEDSMREHGDVVKALESAQQETAQSRMRLQQETAQRGAEREAARAREATYRETLQREKIQHEAEQREAAQREAAHEEARQREATQREEAEREAAQRRFEREATLRKTEQEAAQQQIEHDTAQREVAPMEARSSVASPAASAFGQSTNPFFRKSPQSASERVLSPSIFTQEFGGPATSNDFDDFFGPNESRGVDSSFPTSKEQNENDKVFEDTSTPGIAEASTPATPFTRSVEPPAPPQSRQITSSYLPFKSELTRSESFSSSVRANPPASRSGMSLTGTPTQAPSSPSASMNGDGGSFLEDSQIRSLDSSMEHASPSSTAGYQKAIEHDATHQRSSAETEIQHPQEATLMPTPAEEMPGAFPDTPLTSTPTGGSFTSAQGHVGETSASHSALDDPFSMKEDHLSPASPNHDVVIHSNNSQFASREVSDSPAFPSAIVPSTNFEGTQRADTEFPPIQEVDHGDESESDSDDGFGDDFSAGPTSKDPTSTVSHAATSSTPGNNFSSTSERPIASQSVDEIESDADSLPPTPNAQKSPPTYEQTVPQSSISEHRDVNMFPKEYNGLLPSREIASSPPAEVPQSPPQSLTATAKMPDLPSGVNSGPYQPQSSVGRYTSQSTYTTGPPSFLGDSTFRPPWLSHATAVSAAPTAPTGLPSSMFSDSSYQPQPAITKSTEPVPASSGDDFDDEFADLNEAREVDDFGQDAFAINSNRKDGSDFDAAFDKPIPINPSTLNFQGSSTTAQQSQAPSANRFGDFLSNFKPTTASQQQGSFPSSKPDNSGNFDFGFESSPSSSQAKQAPAPGTFSSFNPAASVTESSSQSYQSSPQLQKPEAASGSHDWDSIFAGLGNNTSSAPGQSNGAAKDPFALDDHIATASSSSQQNYQPARVDDYVTPALPQRAPQQQQPQQSQPDFQQQQRYQPPQSPPQTQKERPVPGRALSTGTEHDDPILKNLTSMGFNRTDALETLERFDYNIDKAVDFLSKRQK